MREKKHRGSILMLWCILIGLTGVICYLSFQNGEDSILFGDRLEKFLHTAMGDVIIIDPENQTHVYWMRQLGRMALFFCLGVMTTTAVHHTAPGKYFILKAVLITLFLGFISYFTERMKIHLDSRHYQPVEMIISFIGGMTGFFCMAALLWLFRRLLGISGSKRHKKVPCQVAVYQVDHFQ